MNSFCILFVLNIYETYKDKTNLNGYINKTEIAFDFDSVVADTMGFFVDIVRNEYGRKDINLEDITDYDLRNCLDVSTELLIEIGIRIMSENSHEYLKPMDGAVEALNSFVKDSSHLLIVTARPQKKPVELWIKKYIEVDESSFEVVATGDFNAKTEVLKEHNKKYLVEDRIETCFELKKNGFEPIVFVQPWNRKPNDFIEVASWKDLSELLDD